MATAHWEELANALHHVLLIGVKGASSDLQVDSINFGFSEWYPLVGSLLNVSAMNNVFDLVRL